MERTDYLSAPDEHLSPGVAAAYDRSVADRFAQDVITPTIQLLAELAGVGTAVEFAVGTGRVALPLAAAGIDVQGIDFSEAMLGELRRKDDAGTVRFTAGDMTTTQVREDATLVYLVFNTITNLRTQEQQVACFRNAAAHLQPGGRFVIENNVPKLHALPPGETIRPFDISPTHLGFDEYVDLVNQISVLHHYFIPEDTAGDSDGVKARRISAAFRYVWPSELDLMAQLAGMTLENRWADWNRTAFTGESPAHVSIWQKAGRQT